MAAGKLDTHTHTHYIIHGAVDEWAYHDILCCMASWIDLWASVGMPGLLTSCMASRSEGVATG